MNVYHDYIEQKGYTVKECYKPAAESSYPRTIYGRTFDTYEEYQEAIHDFLNGQ
jgi:hypothetical protein